MSMIRTMPQISPGGHQIQVVSGDPVAIKVRGTQISDLAANMRNSATLMRNLVENGAEMTGDAIDKLAALSKEVYGDLARGGDLYAAVALYIIGYARNLEASQSSMTTIIEDLCDRWDEYRRMADAADAASFERPEYPTGDDAADETLRKQAEQERDEAAKAASDRADAARAAWDDRAREYDIEWDSWHSAFTSAAQGIRDDMQGKIEDSWNDDLGGFLDFMADVLAVAGIILAVLSIIVGGPLIAALAGIVAVLTLAVALTRAIRGEGSWVDVVFGVIGVIPFIGPAARGLRAFGSAPAGTGFLARITPAAGWSAWSRQTDVVRSFPDFTARLFAGHSLTEFTTLTSGTAIGVETLEMVGKIWSAQFGIAGAIKDSAGGAWSGAFDPDQNPFS
ncbi:MAG: hypothetical protein QM630_05470 [Microbacterium sp.]